MEEFLASPCAGNSVKLNLLGSALIALLTSVGSLGCSLFPVAYQREQIHHPFSKVQCVAILPFYNQSNNPTVDTEVVAQTYDAALQAIPGFEVLPVGVTDAQWLIYSQQHDEPVTREHFKNWQSKWV